jgi:hypothetical protein
MEDMPMSKRYAFVFLAIALITALAMPAAVAAKKPSSGGTVTAPVTGTFTDALGGTGTFSGTFTPTSASSPTTHSTSLTGTLAGTLTDSANNLVGTVTQAPATFQVIGGSGACQILDLVLGPLNLDLLGLVVHLDTVHLNITAQSGPGNLLGNLLCAVAGLLDGNTLGTALTNLLNRILGLLGGL